MMKAADLLPLRLPAYRLPPLLAVCETADGCKPVLGLLGRRHRQYPTA